jgi:hypothetical protein
MTGVLFSKLCFHHLGKIDFDDAKFNEKFLNRLNMMRHHQDFKI